RKSLPRALDDKRRQAARIALLLFLRVGPRDDEEVVGDVGERNPALLAAQHVAVAVLHGGGLNRARVAAGARLGETVAGQLLPLRLRHEIALLLVLGAPRQKGETVE